MDVLIAIPARFASTRFPGKPLVELAGPDGERRTLIRRCWDAATEAARGRRVVIATDDARIRDHARSFGAEVAMTSPACANGSERCADLLSRLDATPDVVVNLQGDAPLTPPAFVAALIDAMEADSEVAVATPVLRCDSETLAMFREDRRQGRVGGTTAVFDREGRALYFSKEVVPYASSGAEVAVFHHVGLYAYRAVALAAYARWPTGPLERAEGLEQLRFLENGASVRCVVVNSPGHPFWEVNNPEDVARVESALAQRAARA